MLSGGELDLAVGELEAAGREITGVGAGVCDVEDGRDFALMELLKKSDDLLAGALVEGGERFVEAEDAGARSEGSPEGNSLGFAATEVFGPTIEQGGDPEAAGE